VIRATTRRARRLLLCAVLAWPCVATAQTRTIEILGPNVAPRGDSLIGEWKSSLPEHAHVHVRAGVDSSVVAITPGVFQASCYVEGASLVGLARFARPVELTGAAWARFRLLRATWTDSTTLRVTWISPSTSRAESVETWRYAGSSMQPERRGTASADGDSLPRLGDFIYVEQLPEAIDRVPPDYPSWAREKGVQGTVMVQALVGKDGRVKQTIVVSSIPMLDDYAQACIKQWRFKPAMAKGVPVAVWVGIPVKFSLH